MSIIEWIRLLPNDKNPTEGKFRTQRYEIDFKELRKGGPAGYESTYLVTEGDPASEEMYATLDKLDGRFLPIESSLIRHRNGEVLLDQLSNGHRLGIASGFKPSGPYHFGHKLASGAVAYFQRNGVQIFVPVADIEADLDTRLTREAYRYWAADNLLDWGANGVNLDAAHVYLQSEEHRVNRLAYTVARNLTLDLVVDIYGLKKMVEDFPFFFAGMTQVGDIILPQHPEFGNSHSFMVSGQDQDGHMKMTIALVERALNEGIQIPGLQTIPSSFYIPHIRGLKGSKQSSSIPTETIYLGSGPEKTVDLDSRVRMSKEKVNGFLNGQYSDDSRRGVERFALDMVRLIDLFNAHSIVNFGELVRDLPSSLRERLSEEHDGEKRAELIDNYLIEESKRRGQDNVEIILEGMRSALQEHQRRRKAVFDYAAQKTTSHPHVAWDRDYQSPVPPDFWKVPQEAVVDPAKRNETRWYDIVYENRELLLP